MKSQNSEVQKKTKNEGQRKKRLIDKEQEK